MIRRCEICGREENEYWMESYNAGRTQIWVCAGCKRKGIREVNLSEALKKRARKKEEHRR